jgi:colanic acid biosynthesis glycosyl transferase WcaI
LTGIGKYTGDMAEWLAARGHHVRVVTAPPYYPDWRISEDYRGTWYRTENRDDPSLPTVFRTPIYVPQSPSGLKRVLHLFSFMIGSVPTMVRQIFWKPDVVWTVEPTFFGAPLALLVATASGAQSWLHVQDFEVDAAFDLGLLPAKGLIHDIALRLERYFTDRFSRVSSISSKMLERSIAKGVPAAQATLFPNWVDIDSVYPHPIGVENSFRRELGLDDKIILLYSGNMGNKQGLEVLAPLAKAFQENKAVHFVLCGNGTFRPQLENLVAESPNVSILPLQPLERLNDLLNAADIHLLPQRSGAADLVMPSKLTGMLSSGRPIIVTAEAKTQVAQVVSGSTRVVSEPCGIVVPAEDPVALHQAVDRLVQSPELRASLGQAARRYAVQYLGRDQVLARFEQDLLSLARRRERASEVN